MVDLGAHNKGPIESIARNLTVAFLAVAMVVGMASSVRSAHAAPDGAPGLERSPSGTV